MKSHLTKIILALWLATGADMATAFGAANDLKFTQKNAGDTAWVDHVFAPSSTAQFTTLATFRTALGLGTGDTPVFAGVTGFTATDLTLSAGSSGASLVLGKGASGGATLGLVGKEIRFTSSGSLTNDSTVNVAAFQSLDQNYPSAIRFVAHDGAERGAIGYQSVSIQPVFSGFNFMESSNLAAGGGGGTGAGKAAKFNFVNTGLYEAATRSFVVFQTGDEGEFGLAVKNYSDPAPTMALAHDGRGVISLNATTAASGLGTGVLRVTGGSSFSKDTYHSGIHITPATGFAQVETVAPSASDASYFAVTPFGSISASNPIWLAGHRQSAHGPLSWWRYTGSHQSNSMSLSTSGVLSVAGGFSGSVGSVSAPTHTFSDDTGTGLYSIGTGFLGIAAGGIQVLSLYKNVLGSTGATILYNDVSVAPSSSPSSGVLMYAESGALKTRSPAGAVSTLGPIISVTGNITGAAYIGGVQALSGAGAVNVTTQTTALTTSGVAQALTLADGTNGQTKTIIHDVDGGSAILTPTTKTGFSTVTFTNVGETVTLQFLTTRGWFVLSSYGAVVAP